MLFINIFYSRKIYFMFLKYKKHKHKHNLFLTITVELHKRDKNGTVTLQD